MISLVIGLRPFRILFSIVRSMCSLLAHELWPPACLTSERSRRMRSSFSRIRRLLLGRTPIGNSSNSHAAKALVSTPYQTAAADDDPSSVFTLRLFMECLSGLSETRRVRECTRIARFASSARGRLAWRRLEMHHKSRVRHRFPTLNERTGNRSDFPAGDHASRRQTPIPPTASVRRRPRPSS